MMIKYFIHKYLGGSIIYQKKLKRLARQRRVEACGDVTDIELVIKYMSYLLTHPHRVYIDSPWSLQGSGVVDAVINAGKELTFVESNYAKNILAKVMGDK